MAQGLSRPFQRESPPRTSLSPECPLGGRASLPLPSLLCPLCHFVATNPLFPPCLPAIPRAPQPSSHFCFPLSAFSFSPLYRNNKVIQVTEVDGGFGAPSRSCQNAPMNRSTDNQIEGPPPACQSSKFKVQTSEFDIPFSALAPDSAPSENSCHSCHSCHSWHSWHSASCPRD